MSIHISIIYQRQISEITAPQSVNHSAKCGDNIKNKRYLGDNADNDTDNDSYFSNIFRFINRNRFS